MKKKREKLKVIQGGRPRKSKWRRHIFSVGIIAVSGFLVWHSMGFLTLFFANSTIARHAEVSTNITVDCIVVSDEVVIFAPQGGEYIKESTNGDRVRVGQTIARITGAGNSYDLVSPSAGLIRHGSDGFEGKFNTANSIEALVEHGATIIKHTPVLSSPTSVSTNNPVAVVIDNVRFQLLTKLDFMPEVRRHTLRVNTGSQELKINITHLDIMADKDKYWVLWNAPTLPDSLGLERVFSAELVAGTQQLVLVPTGALYRLNGESGVFVLYRNKPVFNAVEVVYTGDGMLGVAGLADGQRVLSLPAWASFAKRWWHN